MKTDVDKFGSLLHQHTNRMDEIVSLHNTLVPSDLTQAISDLSQELLVHFVDSVTSMALEKQVTARVAQKDEDHRALVSYTSVSIFTPKLMVHPAHE